MKIHKHLIRHSYKKGNLIVHPGDCGFTCLVDLAESAFVLNPAGHNLDDAQHRLHRINRPDMAATAFFSRGCSILGHLRRPFVDSHAEKYGVWTGLSKN
jgi:hypothetical protein